MRPYLGTALNVAPVRDVSPTVRPSVPRLRFSLNFKFGGNIALDKSNSDTDTDTDTEFYYTLAAISRIAE